jgi:hypothetical protein
MFNETGIPHKVEEVSSATRNRLETLNQYDSALYEWANARFARQIEPLEPDFFA